MTSHRTIPAAASVAIFAALAGCGGGSSGQPCTGLGFLANPFCVPVKHSSAGSRLSIFNLHGETTSTQSYRGTAAMAVRESDATTHGLATLTATVSPGAADPASDAEIDDLRFSTSSTSSSSPSPGSATTDAASRLDGEGGAYDAFRARVTFSLGGQYHLTDDATVKIRNTDGAAGSGLQYATYGYWKAPVAANSSHAAADEAVGVAFGQPTSPGAIPSAGTASYSGGMVGVYTAAQSVPREATGAVDLSVDFTGRTIEGTIRDISAGGTQLRDIGLSQDVMSGSRFLGDAATLAARPGQTGPAMSGSYIGDLYGPGAEEAAGAFSIAGAGNSLVGGFAGKR